MENLPEVVLLPPLSGMHHEWGITGGKMVGQMIERTREGNVTSQMRAVLQVVAIGCVAVPARVVTLR
jgi:hypothetical protein